MEISHGWLIWKGTLTDLSGTTLPSLFVYLWELKGCEQISKTVIIYSHFYFKCLNFNDEIIMINVTSTEQYDGDYDVTWVI